MEKIKETKKLKKPVTHGAADVPVIMPILRQLPYGWIRKRTAVF